MYGVPVFIRWFSDIGLSDVPLVGGKNASLGELYREMQTAGVRVPNGFAITADGYRHFLRASGLEAEIATAVRGLQTADLAALAACGLAIRQKITSAAMPADLEQDIFAAYEQLGEGAAIAVAMIPFLVFATLFSYFALGNRKWQQGSDND